MATVAVFLALGGGAAVAAGGLGKGTVGTKQLKKNAVTAAKIKPGAVTGAKIRLATLGVVPAALTAQSAQTALAAQRADAAGSAQVAARLTAPEPWHEVGTPGEPGFENGWANVPYEQGQGQTAAFFKDHEGIVHLRGLINGGVNEASAFHLPPGYRPSATHGLYLLVSCDCSPNSNVVGLLIIDGADGGVEAPGKFASLDGITFRAES
jgi:hypothetical protein